jgi:hypothetical protein
MKNINKKITGWISLLTEQLGQADEPDHSLAQLRLERSVGTHRSWILACLHAIDAIRAGQTITLDLPLPTITFPAPASHGARTAEAVWQAYLQSQLGVSAATTWLDDCIRSLSPTALRAGIEDNPEPWWANELLILHALQSHVLMSGRDDLQSQLDDCIAFHLAEIQPDHATNEPWAIHAFAAHPQGDTSAGALLHAAMVQGGGALTPPARLILRDAVRSMRQP